MRLTPWLLLLSACTGQPADSDDTTEDGDGTEGTEAPIEDRGHCAEPVGAATSDPLGFRVETEHYDLRLSVGTAAEAEDLGRFLEASWGAMAEWFGAEPPEEDLPLKLRLYPDAATWGQAIQDDDGTVPVGAGGFYWPPSETAYVQQQPTDNYDYTLVLHEALHQFHAQARSPNLDVPEWYAEGLAETLSRHHWDGECVEIGVVPLITFEDLFKVAAEELESSAPPLAAILSGSNKPTRAVDLAIFRALDEDPELTEGFAAFRAEVDGGAKNITELFKTHVGEPQTIAPLIQEAALATTEPLAPIYLEWRPLTAHSALGWSTASYSAARLKVTPSTFTTTASWSEGGYVGVLVGYAGPDGHQGVLVDKTGEVTTLDIAGEWTIVGKVKKPGPEVIFTVAHDGDDAIVGINGEEVTVPRLYPEAAGLALYDGTVVFSGL